MTHTPERWEADESGLYVFAYDSAGGACVAVEIRGWGMLSNKFGEEKAIEIQKERAHRIAAAPDMLEALGIVLSLMDESSGVVGYHLNGEVATWEELGIREEVEAAIRKARGEEWRAKSLK